MCVLTPVLLEDTKVASKPLGFCTTLPILSLQMYAFIFLARFVSLSDEMLGETPLCLDVETTNIFRVTPLCQKFYIQRFI